ncbi:MAG: ribonuclease R family protein [Acidithiobacillales bacterium]
MSSRPLSERIVEALRPRGSRILTTSDLARKVLGAGAGDEETAALRAALAGLEREGRVVRVRGERLSLIENTDFAAGALALRGEGRAFVLSGEPGVPDIPIRPGHLGSALDGDVVIVRLEKPARRKGRAAGRSHPVRGAVVKVIVRRRDTVVGKLVRGPDGTFVVPFDRKIDARLRVPDGKDLGAPEGIFVEARILAYPDDKRLALAEVIATIGFEGEPGVDVEVVARKWGLPRVHPEAALREAEAASGAIGDDERAARADFTGRTIVTIDGENARDFDDAIEAEEIPEGGFRVGVHIADVSHHVVPGSALDAEAFERGTSVYFPDRALAMLPERLSNDLCSLRPAEERRTVSAILTLDVSGETVRAEFARSLIKSKARLTYAQVGRFLEGERPGDFLEGERKERDREPPAGRSQGSETAARRAARALDAGQPGAAFPISAAASAAAAYEISGGFISPEVAAMLRVAQRAAQLLRRRREARGSLDFDLPDADVILGETGDIVAIAKAVRNEAHRLIEEFMIAANGAVAKHLLFVPTPAPYRVHDRPDESRLVDLRTVLGPLGYDIPEDEEEVRPAVFQAILDRAAGTPEERFVSDLVLRAQRKAVYSEECRGHYALAAPYYTHFTSPIRRYPDLLVHRALVEWLAARRAPAAEEAEGRTRWLKGASVQCSDRERRAESAEREAVAWKKFVYLKDHVGEEFDAWVTAVVGFGLFVTLDAIYVDGLVPISSLEDDFYRYDEVGHQLVGSQFGRVYRLGDRLRVKLARADAERRTLDFTPAGASAGPRRRSRVGALQRGRPGKPGSRRR